MAKLDDLIKINSVVVAAGAVYISYDDIQYHCRGIHTAQWDEVVP
jgi:hypothetical protein